MRINAMVLHLRFTGQIIDKFTCQYSGVWKILIQNSITIDIIILTSGNPVL